MGLVVPFGVRPTNVKRPKPDRPCEVTIFPGVRYDRKAYPDRLSGRAVADSIRSDVRLTEETLR